MKSIGVARTAAVMMIADRQMKVIEFTMVGFHLLKLNCRENLPVQYSRSQYKGTPGFGKRMGTHGCIYLPGCCASVVFKR